MKDVEHLVPLLYRPGRIQIEADGSTEALLRDPCLMLPEFKLSYYDGSSYSERLQLTSVGDSVFHLPFKCCIDVQGNGEINSLFSTLVQVHKFVRPWRFKTS